MIVVDTDEIARIVTRHDGRVFLVSHVTRVGASALCAAIEWYWYTPQTARNRFFDVYGTTWAGMHWLITAFPNGRLQAARRLAKQLGLRIANGPPFLMGKPGATVYIQATSRPSQMTEFTKEDVPMEFFPGTILPDGKENMALYTVENDHGSPVYKNRRRDDDAMFQAGTEIVELLNKGVKLTPQQIADYIYGSGPFPCQE